MSALGLAVAVPAVLGYNFLRRRNKSIAEQLNGFTVDLLAHLVSNGAVKPTIAAAPAAPAAKPAAAPTKRSEEHTSELQSLMRISYAVFCLKKKNINIL